MNEKEKQIIPKIILLDLKYLSVRRLYFDWFFPTGAEVANQLIDAIIKTYLISIEKSDLIKDIRSWRGDETHNTVRIIKMLVTEINIDFDIRNNEAVLNSIYKLYQNRYLDMLENTGECKTLLGDLRTVDYTYKYFRDKIKLSLEAKNELLINKLFFNDKDLLWGEDKASLSNIFYRNNQSFKK